MSYNRYADTGGIKCCPNIRGEAIAGGVRIWNDCCGNKGGSFDISTSGGGGGAFLPLAGGSMDIDSIVKFTGGSGITNNIDHNGFVFQGFGSGTQLYWAGGSGFFGSIIIPGSAGTLKVNAGVQFVNSDSTYGGLLGYYVTAVIVDASAGPVTINLPTSGFSAGQSFPEGSEIKIIKADSTSNPVNVVVDNGSGTISGSPIQIMTIPNAALALLYASFSPSAPFSNFYIV